jgi:hypothetical protein
MKRKVILGFEVLMDFAVQHPDHLRELLDLLHNLGFEVLVGFSQIVHLGALSEEMDSEDALKVSAFLPKLVSFYGIHPLPQVAAQHASIGSRLNYLLEARTGHKEPLERELVEEARDAKADIVVTYMHLLLAASANHPGLPRFHGAFGDPWFCTAEELLLAVKREALTKPRY